MIFGSTIRKGLIGPAKTTIILSVVFFLAAFAGEASAQKKFSRNYPTGQNVRLTLTNRTGMVEVIGWDRPNIYITAVMEDAGAVISPQSLSGTIVVNLLRDNGGREIGSVNFKVYVPVNAIVDIETRIGNLSVSNVNGSFVRAHISSEGDITLMNIGSPAVRAENVMGDIFYDGTIQEDGNYRFQSTSGRINLRIPFPSSFTVVATAPSTRSINFGPFAGADFNSIGDGRRIIGRVGTGSATINVTNQQGTIGFLRR